MDVGVVVAGGEGKRLRPLTYYFQKCMIPVGSLQKPLLEYVLRLLGRNGISDVKLLVGYKHQQIRNYFNDGDRFGLHLDYYLDDPELGGSGGALLNAHRKGAFKDADSLLLYYGDILSDINLSEMLKHHHETGAVATLAVTQGYKVPVGVVELDGSRVSAMEEKPWIELYAGIGMVALDPRVMKVTEELAAGRGKIDVMGDVIPSLLENEGRVEAYITDCFWYDVGSTEKYEKLDNHQVDELIEN